MNWKRVVCLFFLAFLPSLSFSSSSSSSSVYDEIKSIPSLSLFASVLREECIPPRLKELLEKPNANITMFVPSDSAMERELANVRRFEQEMGLDSENTDTSSPLPCLHIQVILYHILESIKWTSSMSSYEFSPTLLTDGDDFVLLHQHPQVVQIHKHYLPPGIRIPDIDNNFFNHNREEEEAQHKTTHDIQMKKPWNVTGENFGVSVVFGLSGVDLFTAHVVYADLEASNGVIHVIDRLLIPPLPPSFILTLFDALVSEMILLGVGSGSGSSWSSSSSSSSSPSSSTPPGMSSFPSGDNSSNSTKIDALFNPNSPCPINNFMDLLNRTGLMEEIDLFDSVTILAPDDCGFASIDFDTMKMSELKELARRHIVSDTWYSTRFKSTNSSAASADDDSTTFAQHPCAKLSTVDSQTLYAWCALDDDGDGGFSAHRFPPGPLVYPTQPTRQTAPVTSGSPLPDMPVEDNRHPADDTRQEVICIMGSLVREFGKDTLVKNGVVHIIDQPLTLSVSDDSDKRLDKKTQIDMLMGCALRHKQRAASLVGARSGPPNPFGGANADMAVVTNSLSSVSSSSNERDHHHHHSDGNNKRDDNNKSDTQAQARKGEIEASNQAHEEAKARSAQPHKPGDLLPASHIHHPKPRHHQHPAFSFAEYPVFQDILSLEEANSKILASRSKDHSHKHDDREHSNHHVEPAERSPWSPQGYGGYGGGDWWQGQNPSSSYRGSGYGQGRRIGRGQGQPNDNRHQYYPYKDWQKYQQKYANKYAKQYSQYYQQYYMEINPVSLSQQLNTDSNYQKGITWLKERLALVQQDLDNERRTWNHLTLAANEWKARYAQQQQQISNNINDNHKELKNVEMSLSRSEILKKLSELRLKELIKQKESIERLLKRGSQALVNHNDNQFSSSQQESKTATSSSSSDNSESEKTGREENLSATSMTDALDSSAPAPMRMVASAAAEEDVNGLSVQSAWFWLCTGAFIVMIGTLLMATSRCVKREEFYGYERIQDTSDSHRVV